MLTTPIELKLIVVTQNLLKPTHRMPILHCRCGGLNSTGLHAADVRGCSEEAPDVVRSSLSRVWLQINVVDSADALWCTDVRPRVGNHCIYLITRVRG